MTVVVRRSAVKMWLMAMGAIPLLVISLDVLTSRRITNWLRNLTFAPEDTQIYEPRDVIWAWAMLLFAGFLIVWGLKELFLPTKIVECRDRGLALKINGPLHPPSIVPWERVIGVAGVEIEDEGEALPLLLIEVQSREGLPDNPWGARWVQERQLGMLAEDWTEDPAIIAGNITDYTAEATKRRTAAPVTDLGDGGDKE